MKKLLLVILMSVLNYQVVNAQIQDAITFSLDDVSFDTVGIYTRVTMAECGSTDKVGYPELPRLEIKYILPSNKHVSSVILTDSTTQNLSGNYLVYPKQPDHLIVYSDTVFVTPNDTVYGSNCLLLNKTIEFAGQYNDFGYNIALFYVYPFNYIPSQQTLVFCSSVRFTIQYSDVNEDPLRSKNISEQMYGHVKSIIKSQIKNNSDFETTSGGPFRIVERNQTETAAIDLIQTESGVTPEYLIITNDNDIHGNEIEPYQNQTMTEIFQSLAEWKTEKGVPTVVVSIDDISLNYEGNDIQCKIHNFLHDVYTNYGSMYILFGGDINIVPERMVSDVVGYENTEVNYPTDLYYTAIETTWDSNHNGIFGEEKHDAEDHTSEFFYGRAPVKNCFEASAFVNKTMTYEKMDHVSNRSYVNNVAAIAGALTKSKSGYKNTTRKRIDKALGVIESKTTPNIIENTLGITQDNIVRWRLFESFYNYDEYLHNNIHYQSIGWEHHSFNICSDSVLMFLKNNIIVNSQMTFPHMVYHADHSSYLSLGTSTLFRNEHISRSDVDLFTNNPSFYILYTHGCNAGDYTKDCIINHFLKNPLGGAVAVLASSTICFAAESDNLAKLYSLLYEYKNLSLKPSDPTEYKIGVIHQLLDILDGHPSSDKLCFYRKNHLFGDPELPVWTREPVDLTVSISPSAITNQNGQLTVSVSGMAYSEYSTNDVMVCVMKDGEVYLREPYNGTAHSHDFVFDVHPETAGELLVTVTGHNYIPYQTTVPVTITGKNVYIQEHAVIDPTGNNDGKPDAGETVNLSITLKNNGTVDLSNVNATLSCEFLDQSMNQNINDYLTIVTPTANFGTIAQNTSETKSSLQLTLANTIPDRTPLRCTLTVSDGNGMSINRSFTLLTGAPTIEHLSIRHETKPNGRVELDLELSNTGFGSAKGLVATLSSQNTIITQGTANYGNLSHLESQTQSFELASYGNAFTLSVSDAYNKQWVFDIVLNNVTDTVENLSFENTERSIKLRWDPVEDCRGYYVYRTLTPNGEYERLTSYPIPSSAYPDMGLEVKRTYYYGVSFLDEYGNESEMARITAWTSLPVAEGWPVSLDDKIGRAWGTAPNVADIDGDGRKEIFLATGSGLDPDPDTLGTLYGFTYQGEELYDIDHNPTTVSGFYNIGASMNCTPAIGDIDNDGVMEIAVATRADNNHKLYVFKNEDSDNNGMPDTAWVATLDRCNYNGVVLADLDDDGALEIIAPNQGKNSSFGHTYLEVFNSSGQHYYPKNSIRVPDLRNRDGRAVTMPVVDDLDNDGHKEIVFGLETGVYSWSCHRLRLDTLVPYNQSADERTDCPVIAADIDGDGDKEILYLAVRGQKGFVRAIKNDGTPVSRWSGDGHSISLSSAHQNWECPAYFCVADIDNDGDVEVFIADSDTLKMWDHDGLPFGAGVIRIPDLECYYFQPVIADIDGQEGCEIIVPSHQGRIHAYKPNGNAVPGWPLTVSGLATIPVVTDIDGDGINEIIAASQTEVYVWHTEGRCSYSYCDRSRYNTYNNAVYEIPCSYVTTPLEISDTVIWNDDRYFNKDIIVNNGGSLTVKSRLRMSPEARIIVKPGGRLTLDSCLLTNSCPGEMWQGVEVWGNTSANQYQGAQGQYAQGYVEMKNGATIENAVCALNLWRPDHWSTTGGIAHATDAVFRNNAKAVHALYYGSSNNGSLTDYNAFFFNCSFSIDTGYLATETFYKHVDLAHVKGIAFRGCSFSVNPDAHGVSYYNMGIAANDAGFSVLSYCESQNGNMQHGPCYEEELVRSSFSGFHSGVYAVNDILNIQAFAVRDAVFTDNCRGIYALNTGYATILNNSFSTGNYYDCSYGIYADGVTGFCIEENLFTCSGTTRDNFGIGVFNSEGINDIYLNTFSGLTCGNVAVGTNTDGVAIPGVEDPLLGLTYTCNQNSGNQIDFCVLEDGGAGCIQSEQGSSTAPAGNTFSGSSYHFFNDGDRIVDYYYSSNETSQTPSSSLIYRLNAIPTNSQNDCLTHYGSVIKSPEEKSELEDGFLEAHDAYNALEQLYMSRIDGGNTASALSDIDAATVSDAWRLRKRLLGDSPYVSGGVLTKAVDREDLFSAQTLFEILAANPDELKRDTLINYIESKGGRLPVYMTEMLRQIASGTTARTALLGQMAKYGHDKALLAGDIVRSDLFEDNSDPQELRAWLGNIGNIAADRLAVASFMQEGDFNSAIALAGTLPIAYGLHDAALADHSDYMTLIGLYRTIRESGRDIPQMTQTERETVEAIANAGAGISKAMAEALLDGISETPRSRHNCPDLPPSRNMGRGSLSTAEAGAYGIAVSVSPNPARSKAAFHYTLPSPTSKALLTLSNTLGVNVLSIELTGDSGSKIIDLTKLSPGVYTYSVTGEGHVYSGKIVVVE